MTPAETRTAILADAARRIDRAQRCHPHALALASAAARQYALPYWTARDSRHEDRRERNSFTQATRTFRGMTDWRQTRGQSADARRTATYRRIVHFREALMRQERRGERGAPWSDAADDARARSFTYWHAEVIAA